MPCYASENALFRRETVNGYESRTLEQVTKHDSLDCHNAFAHLVSGDSRWCLGVATCLAVQYFAMTGNAQTFWTNSGGGFWHTGSNWVGGSPPGPAGTAIFNLPNTYNVLWNNSFGDSVNSGLVVGAGNVTFSNTSPSTRTYSNLGISVITGSGTSLTVGSFPGNIMQLTSGELVVNSGGQVVATAGSRISTSGLLRLGSSGSGTLTARAGGIIQPHC